MICRVIPYEGSEPYIFLSYCHKDSAVVYPLFEKIVQDGYRVWYDNGNNAGDDWPENIAEHLERSHICLAFVSEQSSISHNCKTEISFAIECHKKLVPVFIENFSMPKGMRMQLSSLHYLKKSDFPTDSALLNKVYESDSFQDCKGAPGDLRLKPPEKPEPAPPVKPDPRLIHSLSAPPAPALHDRPAPVEVPAPVSKAAPAVMEIPATVKESPKKKLLKVKPVSRKKKTQLPPAEPSEPVTAPLSAPEPKPIPADPVHNETERPPESKPADAVSMDFSDLTAVSQEETVVPRQEFEDEPTVYEYDLDEKTVCDPDYPFDDEKTVHVSSINIALLLQPSLGKTFLVKGPQTKIGRHPLQCDVVIEGNDSVSKCHASIIQTKQHFYLSDNGSANGTFLNGEKLKEGEQAPLDNPAVFQLNDETLVLVSGPQARKLIEKGSVSMLINEAGTGIRILESETLPLNRSHKWPDGTLSDPKIHRAAHAELREKGNGVYLEDRSPEGGNSTYLNGSRLKHGESRALKSGDHIRLGDTVLEFVTITLKENK